MVNRFGWAVVLLLVLMPPPAAAAEAYFLLVFAAEDRATHKTDKAHSFATFVRAVSAGPTWDGCRIEAFTISWLPETLEVRVRCLRPEPGINLDLHTSLAWAFERGLQVSLWGPYQVERCLYEEAFIRKTELESGRVRYKAIDSIFPAKRVTNCIHAISDLGLHPPRLRLGTPCWGASASYFLVLALQPWIVDGGQTHDWLVERLGLSPLPIERRRLEDGNPNPKPVMRALQDAIHKSYIARRQK